MRCLAPGDELAVGTCRAGRFESEGGRAYAPDYSRPPRRRPPRGPAIVQLALGGIASGDAR